MRGKRNVAGSAGVVGSVKTAGSAGVIGSAATAGSVGVIGSVATAGSALLAGCDDIAGGPPFRAALDFGEMLSLRLQRLLVRLRLFLLFRNCLHKLSRQLRRNEARRNR